MNSKQALDELKENAKNEVSKFKIDRLKIIEEDLEVLEILRKYVFFDKEDNYIKMFDIKECATNFDFEIVKEWLEK